MSTSALLRCYMPACCQSLCLCLLSHGLSIPRQSVLSHKGMQAGNRSVSRPAEGGRQAGRQAVSQFAGQLVSQSVGRTVIHNESKQHAYNYVACLHPFLSVGQSVRSWLGLFVLLIQLCWLINKNRIDRNFPWILKQSTPLFETRQQLCQCVALSMALPVPLLVSVFVYLPIQPSWIHYFLCLCLQFPLSGQAGVSQPEISDWRYCEETASLVTTEWTVSVKGIKHLWTMDILR